MKFFTNSQIYFYLFVLYIFILTFETRICLSSKENPSENAISSFENEYPNIKICQSEIFQTINYLSGSQGIKDIKNKKCTHLQGNLHIRGGKILEDSDNGVLTMDSLVEIDGRLLIENTNIDKISMRNLRVIRGVNFHELKLINSSKPLFVSLQVSGNLNLKELDLRSLRAVVEHDVYFANNPKLHYLPHKVNWSHLFTDPSVQKTVIHSDMSSDLFKKDNCSKLCPMNNCWGAEADQCQKATLCSLKRAKSCVSCHIEDGDEQCCYEQCIGGCTGNGPQHCIACKEVLNGQKCTTQCPSQYTSGPGGTTIKNKDFKYQTGTFCARTCPNTMLPEGSTCVYKCSDGHFKDESNHCVPCYGDRCRPDLLPCEMMKMASIKDGRDFTLNAAILKNFTNCKKIVGYIYIMPDSFTKYNVTVEMLYKHLSKLEELDGGFSYNLDKRLNNLTFLQNLKSFRATNLHIDGLDSGRYNRFSIAHTSLEFLGLKSLKSVIGDFLLLANPRLCYLNLNFSEIVNGKVLKPPPDSVCADKTCHRQCSEKGCWGPGKGMCVQCKNFDAGGLCTSDCSKVNGFFISPSSPSPTNGTCLKCHPECAKTCTGITPDKCVGGCLNKEENGVCVSKCSLQSFEEPRTKRCLLCHEDCAVLHNQSVCSGSSNIPGVGGCKKCYAVMMGINGKISHCVKKCPNERYVGIASNDIKIIQYFPESGGMVCTPCHDLCRKCDGPSNGIENCKLCEGYWSKSKCIKKCSKDNTYGFVRNGTEKHCQLCSKQCKGGCVGPRTTDCLGCNYRRIYINESKFYCSETCTKEKNIEEIHRESGDTVCLTFYESKSKMEEMRRIKITIAVVVTGLVLIIVVIIVVVICLKKKMAAERLEANMKAQYSNLMEPTSKDEDALSRPPNMGRLVIVSIKDLVFEDESRPLGFGAFGYVYKGKWRIPKEDDPLLRKTTADFYLPVAIKVIKNMGIEENEAIMQEAKIMASVSHMHCLRFIGVCLSYEKPCLITAYVKEGSLEKYLVRNKNKITSLIMLSWAEQIADGMYYLSTRGIIHRDLAARNVLVSRLECVQITDFGLSKMLENSKEKEIVVKIGKVPIRWLAIETLLEGKYSHETDVWAYGVTLWEIFTYGKIPYEDQQTTDIADFVLKGGRLPQPEICTLDAYIVMVNCWLESPNLRPSFESLMKTFASYCKNPGRYLSIQGDPYEIPSPNSIQMTNLNNPYYGDQFNFTSVTAETTLPLLNNRDSVDTINKDLISFTNGNTQNEDELRLLSSNEKDPLPTRTSNRGSNILKFFHDSKQTPTAPYACESNAKNPNRLPSVASVDEPTLKASSCSIDEEPRYVTDPTERPVQIRSRENLFKYPLLSETPRFHSNLNSPTQVPLKQTVESDDYLEPVSPNRPNLHNDTEGYLEPVIKNRNKLISDEYMTPSQPNTPRQSNNLYSNTNSIDKSPSYPLRFSKDIPNMDEDGGSPNNLYFPQNLVEEEYLEPTSAATNKPLITTMSK